MRIISKFHDYYDGLNDGSDQEHVWRRETSSFLVEQDDPFFFDRDWELSIYYQMAPLFVPNATPRYSKSGTFLRFDHDEYRRSLLFFCGQVFPLVILADAVCWTFEEFETQIDLPNRPFNKQWERDRKSVYANARKMFSLDSLPARYTTLNLRHKCPVLLLDIQEQDLGPTRERHNYQDLYRVRITLNPRLADLKFQRVVPPYETFQRIEMYLYNELAEQVDPPVEISDEQRRDAHGFDKFSFRKPPSKHK